MANIDIRFEEKIKQFAKKYKLNLIGYHNSEAHFANCVFSYAQIQEILDKDLSSDEVLELVRRQDRYYEMHERIAKESNAKWQIDFESSVKVKPIKYEHNPNDNHMLDAFIMYFELQNKHHETNDTNE